jgi:hypothetical protein
MASHQSHVCADVSDRYHTILPITFTFLYSNIGTALWLMYLGGRLEAMDILFASTGWIALIDGIVCAQDGAPGSAMFRAMSTGVVALWGMSGMTSGKYF